jgi:hypothetical protein
MLVCCFLATREIMRNLVPASQLPNCLISERTLKCVNQTCRRHSLFELDDPLRHWRKGKSEAILRPKRISYSNLNKNSSLENLMLSKFLDAGPSTSIPPMIFCSAIKK